MTPYDEVVSLLPKLSSDEKKRIVERLKAEGNVTGFEAAHRETDERMVVDALCEIVNSNGLGPVHPTAVRRFSGYKAFTAKLPDLVAFLTKNIRTRNSRRMALELGFRLMLADFRKRQIPPALPTIMAQVHRIPALLDSAFPGYAANGLLNWIGEQERVNVRQERGKQQVPVRVRIAARQ